MYNEKLQEATIHKLLESQYENKAFEEELEKIWQELNDKLENLGFTYKPRSDWKEYKHWGDFVTEPVEVRKGVTRHVEVDAFFALPSFPTWYYYVGAQINKVETSTNNETRWGLQTQGYTSKEELRDAKISISTENGNIVNLGNTIDEFVVAVEKAIKDIQRGEYEPNTIIIDEE